MKNKNYKHGEFMFKRKVQENQDVFSSKINFSLLDPRATFSDLEKVCDISYKYRVM